MDHISRTLSRLQADDIFPMWLWLLQKEGSGELSPEEAVRWRQGLFGLLWLFDLEPSELGEPLLEPNR